MEKFALWAAAIILALLLFIFITLYVYISRSLPMTEGETEIGSISAQARVNRDSNGIPHINASNERDLFIAQGYIQAQDRLFQMDLSRRQASVRLSEVIGDATVENDKYFRTD